MDDDEVEKPENEIIEIKTILNITHGATRTHTNSIPAADDIPMPTLSCHQLYAHGQYVVFIRLYIFFLSAIIPASQLGILCFFSTTKCHIL